MLHSLQSEAVSHSGPSWFISLKRQIHAHPTADLQTCSKHNQMCEMHLQYNPGPGEYSLASTSAPQSQHPSTCFLSNVSRLHESRYTQQPLYLQHPLAHTYKSKTSNQVRPAPLQLQSKVDALRQCYSTLNISKLLGTNRASPHNCLST